MHKNFMKINYKKCGVFKLHSNDQIEIEPTLVGKLIERFPKVNSYKYLGLEINQKL